MDSLTQAMLGASVAAICAPPGRVRTALAAGAALGTLPDLDVLVDYGDPVSNFTHHRSFSHSLIVLAPFSLVLWLALRRWWRPARESPRHWLAAVALALLTHPLLDAHTAYGTQLLWPFGEAPVMWGTVFIIDPLYTLPLITAVIVAGFVPRRAGFALGGALFLSTSYLAWSWYAQAAVRGNLQSALAAQGLADRPLFLTPTPFNTLLWRGIVMSGNGYLETFDSLLVAEDAVRFEHYPSDTGALLDARGIAAVDRLLWFSQGFASAAVIDGRLVLSDLRMGQYPAYVFSFAVAERGAGGFEPIAPVHIPISISDRALAETWRRLREE